MKKRRIRNMNWANRSFYILNGILWILVLTIVLYPMWLVIISSVSDANALLLGEVTWKPVGFTLAGYKKLLNDRQLWISYGNSVLYTVAGTFLAIFCTLTAAYAMTDRDLPGKNVIAIFMMITMFISGGMIPSFLIVRALGLYNTRLFMMITGCVSLWNMMVTRVYIQSTIPRELYEAAQMDGCSHFRYFFKVILPLSKTIVSVLTIYFGVAKWNNYMSGVIYIRDSEKLPLQTYLRSLLATVQTSANLDNLVDDMGAMAMQETIQMATVAKYCLIIIASVPAILLYIILQKYFEKGVMIGSLKG